MAHAQPIVWSIPAFENNYNNERYATDRQNVNAALGHIRAFDVAATQAEEATINGQLPLPHTPDDLSQTVAVRAQTLCNSGDQPPIKFRGVFKFRDASPNEGATTMFICTPPYDGHEAEYADWTSVGISWPSRINALNRIPLANRAAARFRFEVVFGNTLQGLNWTEAKWMETAIHEVGIHVIQGLHCIDLWRRGRDWPDVDGDGNLDHLLFRFCGYRRYNFWRDKMTLAQRQEIWPGVQEWNAKEQERDQDGKDLVNAFYSGTAPASHAPYDFMKCWQLATHFPEQQNQLVKDANVNTLVDKNQSQAFFGVLKGQLDQIFHYKDGDAVPLQQPFHWW